MMEPIKIGSRMLNDYDMHDELFICCGDGIFIINIVPTSIKRSYRAYKYLIGTDIDRLKHLINRNIHL